MFEELHGWVDRLAEEALAAPAGLGPEIVELDRLIVRLQAERARRLAAFVRADGFTDEQPTAAGWLRQRLNVGSRAAHDQLRVAEVLQRLPQLAAAFGSGEVSFDHVRVAAAELAELPEELDGEVDEPLLAAAVQLDPPSLGRYLAELRQVLEPDRQLRKEQRQRAARRCAFGPGFDGMIDLSARLTPEVGEKLSAAMSAASRPDLDGELRSPAQRRADALERILDLVLAGGRLPVQAGNRPQINVTIDLTTLTNPDPAGTAGPDGPNRHLAGTEPTPGRLPPGPLAPGRLPGARFAWTGPTSPDTARRLACDGIVLPIFTRGGEVLDIGRRTRVIPPALRALIIARDRRCRWPGCPLPPDWTEIHHVQFWSHGGPTNRHNCLLLCPTHHHAAHDGRWTLTLDQPGVLHIHPRKADTEPLYRIATPKGPESETGALSQMR